MRVSGEAGAAPEEVVEAFVAIRKRLENWLSNVEGCR